jgi:hypothetical protein
MQTGLVSDARVDVGVDGAVFGAAVDFEEVSDERHFVHDREDPVAFVDGKVVVAPLYK